MQIFEQIRILNIEHWFTYLIKGKNLKLSFVVSLCNLYQVQRVLA